MSTIDELLMDRGRKVHLNEWRSFPSIASLLPYHFAKGSIVESLKGSCITCDKPIKDDNLRGRITPSENDKFIEMRALGYCSGCNILTAVELDVWDDLSMVGPVPNQDEREIRLWKSNKSK